MKTFSNQPRANPLPFLANRAFALNLLGEPPTFSVRTSLTCSSVVSHQFPSLPTPNSWASQKIRLVSLHRAAPHPPPGLRWRESLSEASSEFRGDALRPSPRRDRRRFRPLKESRLSPSNARTTALPSAAPVTLAKTFPKTSSRRPLLLTTHSPTATFEARGKPLHAPNEAPYPRLKEKRPIMFASHGSRGGSRVSQTHRRTGHVARRALPFGSSSGCPGSRQRNVYVPRGTESGVSAPCPSNGIDFGRQKPEASPYPSLPMFRGSAPSPAPLTGKPFRASHG